MYIGFLVAYWKLEDNQTMGFCGVIILPPTMVFHFSDSKICWLLKRTYQWLLLWHLPFSWLPVLCTEHEILMIVISSHKQFLRSRDMHAVHGVFLMPEGIELHIFRGLWLCVVKWIFKIGFFYFLSFYMICEAFSAYNFIDEIQWLPPYLVLYCGFFSNCW